MGDIKPCTACNFKRQKSYGLVVTSLDELKKQGSGSLGFSPSELVTVVLESDGTIVEDQSYFLCLPANTKFMLLREKETWSPVRRTDGGTAWMARDSYELETDAVDFSSTAWLDLAEQMKQDLSSIILMSEADLQNLVDAPCLELASALGFQEKKAKDLQGTLQRFLDRKEQERQSKELLELFVKAVAKEDGQVEEPSQEGTGDVDVPDAIEVDSDSGFTTRTVMVLKGKTSPETRLSTEDLQMVVARGVEGMEKVLGWEKQKTSALLQACEAELTTRLRQIQAVQSIRSNTQRGGNPQSSEKSTGEAVETPAKRSK